MDKLKIIYTSDLHGQIFPLNNKGGLLHCVAEFEKNGRTLILDGGDSLQGSPLLTFAVEDHLLGNTIAPIFNYGNYDYFTLGNHDFDFGYESLKSFTQGMNAKCLTANVVDEKDEIPLLPYAIETMLGGLRVGIAGGVTDFVSIWQTPETLESLSIYDCFSALSECSKALENQCDLKICIYHGGFEEDLETGEPLQQSGENIAGKICRELDYDILLTAHQHTAIEGRYYHGTYVLQLPSKGQKYAEIDVEMEFPIVSIRSKLRTPGTDLPLKLLDSLMPLKDKTDAYLAEELCLLYEPLSTSFDRVKQVLEGSELADLLNFIQITATDADISCVSLPNPMIHLPDRLFVKDVVTAFPHSNKLQVIEITGEILYHGLLRSADYLRWAPQGYLINPQFLRPKPLHDAYDFFANVSYTIYCDPYRSENQVGQVYIQGEPLDLKKTYKLALSDYRASGSGGYPFYQSCPVLSTCEKDIQRLIMDFFREKKYREFPDYHQVKVQLK